MSNTSCDRTSCKHQRLINDPSHVLELIWNTERDPNTLTVAMNDDAKELDEIHRGGVELEEVNVESEEITLNEDLNAKQLQKINVKQVLKFLKQTKTHQSLHFLFRLDKILNDIAAICYFCCFMAIGMVLASLGPSLLALSKRTNRYYHHDIIDLSG